MNEARVVSFALMSAITTVDLQRFNTANLVSMALIKTGVPV